MRRTLWDFGDVSGALSQPPWVSDIEGDTAEYST